MTVPDTSQGLHTDVAGLREHAGRDLGHSTWRTITQERIGGFADVTEDHNFIHVDPERAASTPFGSTIAHGYLTLSLLAPLLAEVLRVDAGVAVNYGLDRVRFPAPVPVGSRIRCRARIAEVTDVAGGVQAKVEATVEVEGSEKPALVAECLFRYLR